ncbi:predicted protein [Candida tropicalis MYA-3404]|uniref:Uncharacterized protein n=1 Tax=Candida tropicalis (strain ATCC MYA-3404 / T1) TaxID=294747 RepID=C5MGX2_CANTT|nr:predicted protein [Candida tropicalis MYA-3404]EER30874.1 predicted protein [Candida tropicalis MYA-3404]KAG4404433.1 hypothetical protein JTP64_006185 [Candida tropicalis]
MSLLKVILQHDMTNSSLSLGVILFVITSLSNGTCDKSKSKNPLTTTISKDFESPIEIANASTSKPGSGFKHNCASSERIGFPFESLELINRGSLLLHQCKAPSRLSGFLIMQRNMLCQKWESSPSFNLKKSIKSSTSLKTSEFSSSNPESRHKINGLEILLKVG